MKIITMFLLVLLAASAATGQKNYVEVRVGHPYYDYEEYTRELPREFTLTFIHLKEAGEHEFSFGFGKTLHVKKSISVTPVAFATFGGQGERGVTIGAYVESEKEKWKAHAFIGRFISVKGETPPYTSMDIGDITRSITKKWDVGLSTTFFCQGGCEVKSGPIIRRNDKLGALEFSYRFGKESNEFRASRVFSF